MSYTHLTTSERYQLFSLQKAGHTISDIANQLDRHRSTIHRELKRNLVFDPRVPGYSPSRVKSKGPWSIFCGDMQINKPCRVM